MTKSSVSAHGAQCRRAAPCRFPPLAMRITLTASPMTSAKRLLASRVRGISKSDASKGEGGINNAGMNSCRQHTVLIQFGFTLPPASAALSLPQATESAFQAHHHAIAVLSPPGAAGPPGFGAKKNGCVGRERAPVPRPRVLRRGFPVFAFDRERSLFLPRQGRAPIESGSKLSSLRKWGTAGVRPSRHSSPQDDTFSVKRSAN